MDKILFIKLVQYTTNMCILSPMVFIVICRELFDNNHIVAITQCNLKVNYRYDTKIFWNFVRHYNKLITLNKTKLDNIYAVW